MGVKKIFIKDFLVNVSIDHEKYDINKMKAIQLGYMVNKIMKTSLNEIPSNDRDNYMYKRVDVSGILLLNIFKDFYAKFKKHAKHMLDVQYQKLKNNIGTTNQKQLDKHILTMCNSSNINTIFSSSFVTEGMNKSFKGNWGMFDDPKKYGGYVQDVNRLSYIGYVSHSRRVNAPIDRSIKLVGPHHLVSSQWGYMCPIESPDGENIGLLKHMAVTCNITPEYDHMDEVVMFLQKHDMLLLYEVISDLQSIYKQTKIIVNNNWIGIHTTPEKIYEEFIKNRREGIIYSHASISWNVMENEIKIFLDAGRCVRPLYINDPNRYEKLDSAEMKWSQLLTGKNGIIEYLDIHESNHSMIAMTKNEMTAQTTHIEIHPSLALSLYTNTVPFANHNQAPRNIFSGQQGKQAIGIYATNFNSRIDTASYILHYPQKCMISTKLEKYVHKDKLPNGENLIVAIATYSGYNQDDSIMINKTSFERGMFNVSLFKSYTDKEDENEQEDEKVIFANPIQYQNKGYQIKPKLAHWNNLEQNGLPKKNSKIEEGDAYLGKINLTKASTTKIDDDTKNIFTDSDDQYEYSDKSSVANKTVEGIVDTVYLYEKNDKKNVKIKFRKMRMPVLGDKMGSMHGQKGVVGMIIPQENMPFTKDGLVPDIIINPHAFPSRMTVSHLLECVLSKLCCASGSHIDGTIFENHDFEFYYNQLQKHGYNKHGNEILYNGRTGSQMITDIFIGPTYYYRIKHMVQDKMNYRHSSQLSNSPVTNVTRQPTKGRANNGGLRIGEMETTAILAHGVGSFIKESMMERADKFSMYLDSVKGESIIYNTAKQVFNVDRQSISKIETPYSFNVFRHEINSLGMNVNMITDEQSAKKAIDS